MSHGLSKGVLAGLTSLTLLCGVAHAQGPAAQPPAEVSELGEITVGPPRIVQRSIYGLMTKEMSMSLRVSYSDLDMRTPAGATELDRRLTEAAHLLCERLETAYPDSRPEHDTCVKEALGGAQPQVLLARASD